MLPLLNSYFVFVVNLIFSLLSCLFFSLVIYNISITEFDSVLLGYYPSLTSNADSVYHSQVIFHITGIACDWLPLTMLYASMGTFIDRHGPLCAVLECYLL